MYEATGDPSPSEPTFVPTYRNDDVRAVALVNGIRSQIISYRITFNGHGATDSAELVIPLSSGPDWSIVCGTATPADGSTPPDIPVYVEIYAGYPTAPPPGGNTDNAGLSTRFLGIVDSYDAHFGHENTVTFSCRSLAAPLVDNKITNPIGAMTSKDFVTYAAGTVGLTVNFQLMPGQAPIPLQQVFAREFIGGANFESAIHNKRIWDLLLQCGLFDDADVWVDLGSNGQTPTLNYVSPEALTRTPVLLTWGTDAFIDCSGTHSPQYSKNVEVEVRTSRPRIKQSTSVRVSSPGNGSIVSTPVSKTVTASIVPGTNESYSQTTNADGSTSYTVGSSSGGNFSSGFTTEGSESGKQRYVRYINNLDPATAIQIAKGLQRDISMHEYALKMELAMTPDLLATFDVTSLVTVQGLPFALFNTDAGAAGSGYWPRKIEESMDARSGWRMSVDLLNHALAEGAV